MTFHLQPVFWDSTENGGFQGIQRIWRSNHHWSSRYDTSIRPGLDWWNSLLNFLPECIAKDSRLWVDWAFFVFFETSKHFFTQKAKTKRPEHSRNSNCANAITSMPGRLEILKSMGLAEIWQIQIFLELKEQKKHLQQIGKSFLPSRQLINISHGKGKSPSKILQKCLRKGIC